MRLLSFGKRQKEGGEQVWWNGRALIADGDGHPRVLIVLLLVHRDVDCRRALGMGGRIGQEIFQRLLDAAGVRGDEEGIGSMQQDRVFWGASDGDQVSEHLHQIERLDL